MILIDSNIIIEMLNGKEGSLERILKYDPNQVYISVVTEWEVIAGAYDKRSQTAYQKALTRFNIIQFDKQISEHTGILLKTYGLSHGLNIPDALIAATAIKFKIPLLTLNQKDFTFISGLDLETV